jgi:hypothetical protein
MHAPQASEDYAATLLVLHSECWKRTQVKYLNEGLWVGA